MRNHTRNSVEPPANGTYQHFRPQSDNSHKCTYVPIARQSDIDTGSSNTLAKFAIIFLWHRCGGAGGRIFALIRWVLHRCGCCCCCSVGVCCHIVLSRNIERDGGRSIGLNEMKTRLSTSVYGVTRVAGEQMVMESLSVNY